MRTWKGHAGDQRNGTAQAGTRFFFTLNCEGLIIILPMKASSSWRRRLGHSSSECRRIIRYHDDEASLSSQG